MAQVAGMSTQVFRNEETENMTYLVIAVRELEIRVLRCPKLRGTKPVSKGNSSLPSQETHRFYGT
jgi:hypothetical protein